MADPTYARDLENAEANLEARKSDYLSRWGWKLTCNTPGSYWLWQRDFSDLDKLRADNQEAIRQRCAAEGREFKGSPNRPYGTITAPLDLAVSMTRSVLDERKEDDDDDD